MKRYRETPVPTILLLEPRSVWTGSEEAQNLSLMQHRDHALHRRLFDLSLSCDRDLEIAELDRPLALLCPLSSFVAKL
jgi:hypothetical protein